MLDTVSQKSKGVHLLPTTQKRFNKEVMHLNQRNNRIQIWMNDSEADSLIGRNYSAARIVSNSFA